MIVLTTSVNSRRSSVHKRLYSDTTFRKRVFRDNFVIFRLRSKRIAFLESANFSTFVCMQIFNVRDGHVTMHFSAPFLGLYLPNAWTQTLQTSKRYTLRASAFHRCHWFGVNCFLRLCVGSSKGTLETRKMLFLHLAPPTLQNSGIFHDSTRPHLHSDTLPPNSRRSVVSI